MTVCMWICVYSWFYRMYTITYTCCVTIILLQHSTLKVSINGDMEITMCHQVDNNYEFNR